MCGFQKCFYLEFPISPSGSLSSYKRGRVFPTGNPDGRHIFTIGRAHPTLARNRLKIHMQVASKFGVSLETVQESVLAHLKNDETNSPADQYSVAYQLTIDNMNLQSKVIFRTFQPIRCHTEVEAVTPPYDIPDKLMRHSLCHIAYLNPLQPLSISVIFF